MRIIIILLALLWPGMASAEFISSVSSFNMTITTAVSSTGTIGTSGVFPTRVRAVCTSDCHVAFVDEYVAATSNGVFLPADVPAFFNTSGGVYVVVEGYAAGFAYIDVLR